MLKSTNWGVQSHLASQQEQRKPRILQSTGIVVQKDPQELKTHDVEHIRIQSPAAVFKRLKTATVRAKHNDLRNLGESKHCDYSALEVGELHGVVLQLNICYVRQTCCASTNNEDAHI